MALSEDHISRPWIENTTSITSHAQYARLSLVRKTATMNTTGKFIATTTIQHSLLNGATDAKQPS
jgi:hypothetical protein